MNNNTSEDRPDFSFIKYSGAIFYIITHYTLLCFCLHIYLA